MTKPEIKAMLEKQGERIYQDGNKWAADSAHRHNLMQKRSQDAEKDNKWNIEHFRYMDEKAYADDVPKGYHHDEFTPFLT